MARQDPRSDENKLHDWCNGLLEDRRHDRRVLEAQWWENIATYSGDLWADYDVTLKKLIEPARPDHRVRIPVNLARPAVRTEYAKLLKNRPIVDCLARSGDKVDLNAADVGDKLLYNYIEKELHMGRYRRRMLAWLVLCGTAGMFVDCDDTSLSPVVMVLDPDTKEPISDERLMNAVRDRYREKHQKVQELRIPQPQLRHVALSPFQFVWDGSKTEYDEAWWMIVSEVFDVDEVFHRWGVDVEPDKDAVPGIIERRMLEKWDMTGKMEWRHGSTQKLVEINRMFVRPGHRWFPDGAEVVFTQKEIIADVNFPYKHGMLPFGVCGHVPMPVSQYSLSVLPDLKPLVLEVSKTVSQLIENRNLMANPPWIEYKQNRIEGEIQNKPGMRLTIDWHPQVPEPHPIEMPEIPTYVQNLIPVMKETIQEVAGQSEVSQGKVPAGARAGVTIAYLQEEDDTKISPTIMEYEDCMERVAWLDLMVIAERYDTPRTTRIYRNHAEPEVLDFTGNMLNGIAGVVCQSGSALPRSKAAKQQYILDLWDRKLEQDPRKVREMLELNQGEPDEWEQAMNQAERENKMLQQGLQPEVREWYNHPAHHYVHRTFMISPEFFDLDPAIQQRFNDHDEEHSSYERQQQTEQMAQQAVMGGAGSNAPAGAPAPGGGNGVTATPQPPFADQSSNGFAPPEDGSTSQPQSYSPQ